MKRIIIYNQHGKDIQATVNQFARQFDFAIVGTYSDEISVDDALRLARRAGASLLII